MRIREESTGCVGGGGAGREGGRERKRERKREGEEEGEEETERERALETYCSLGSVKTRLTTSPC